MRIQRSRAKPQAAATLLEIANRLRFSFGARVLVTNVAAMLSSTAELADNEAPIVMAIKHGRHRCR
jgi:hypothetical protein